MSLRRLSFALLIAVLAAVGLFSSALFAGGSPFTQADATAQQATIDALVGERFTQTAQAAGPNLTATAVAQQTQQAASIQQTVDAAFNAALTATLQAGSAVETGGQTTSGIQLVLVTPVQPVDQERMERSANVIRRRLEALNVTGATVSVENGGRIVINLPPVPDTQAVVDTLLETGFVELVDFSGLAGQAQALVGQTVVTTAGEQRRRWAGAPELTEGQRSPLTNEPFATVVTRADIQNAEAVEGEMGWMVRFEFTEDGGQRMLEFSRGHIGEPLGIVIDNVVQSAPVIQGEFGTGGGLISGLASREEAEQIATQLNSGALLYYFTLEQMSEIAFTAQSVTATATTRPTQAPTATQTPDFYPTTTVGQVRVAEQVFEGGRMMWVQPVGQIWVMIAENGQTSGEWVIYEDTFEEGEIEFDPSIVPPDDRYQPERGFGKVWREHEEVREALGWALTPEFGYDSRYEYHPGGEVEGTQYTPGPGYHALFTLYGDELRFNEDDGTWELIAPDEDDE